MAGAGYIHGGVGSATLPLLASDIDDNNLEFSDPSQALLLELFCDAMNAELAAAWKKACESLPEDSLLAASASPVATKLRDYPSKEYLSEVGVQWPALVVARKEDGTAERLTVDMSVSRSKWEVTWVLGPVGFAECEKLQGSFAYFRSVVAKVIEQGGHAAYQEGKLVLVEGTSPFLAIAFAGYPTSGWARVDEDGPQVLAVTVTLEGIEQSVRTTDHLSAARGLEWHEDLRDGASPVIADFVVDETTCGT